MTRIIKHPVLALTAIVIGIAWYGTNATSTEAVPDAGQAADTGQENSAATVAKNASNSAAPTFVGREVCRECHAENFELHSRHGHASTFRSVRGSAIASKLSGKTFDAGEGYGTYKYSTDPDGNLFVSLPSQFDEARFPLQYLLGSGLHAQTMVTLLPSPNGKSMGIEHRVSCYRDDQLGLTPSHAQKKPRSMFEYFGDSLQGEPFQRCIYCHTTQAKLAGETIEGLIANVNCEKCHGPGSEHVRLARIHDEPPRFSIGEATWDAESELQLCGDCHRLPRHVTEKEIREYSKFLVRFQPIGLVQSRCYLDSNRQLKCTTCHNPHQSIRELDTADHIQDCLECHQPGTTAHVSCPVEPESGCIECHMPAIELDQGLRFHDHWIRVHED